MVTFDLPQWYYFKVTAVLPYAVLEGDLEKKATYWNVVVILIKRESTRQLWQIAQIFIISKGRGTLKPDQRTVCESYSPFIPLLKVHAKCIHKPTPLWRYRHKVIKKFWLLYHMLNRQNLEACEKNMTSCDLCLRFPRTQGLRFEYWSRAVTGRREKDMTLNFRRNTPNCRDFSLHILCGDLSGKQNDLTGNKLTFFF